MSNFKLAMICLGFGEYWYIVWRRKKINQGLVYMQKNLIELYFENLVFMFGQMFILFREEYIIGIKRYEPKEKKHVIVLFISLIISLISLLLVFIYLIYFYQLNYNFYNFLVYISSLFI